MNSWELVCIGGGYEGRSHIFYLYICSLTPVCANTGQLVGEPTLGCCLTNIQ